MTSGVEVVWCSVGVLCRWFGLPHMAWLVICGVWTVWPVVRSGSTSLVIDEQTPALFCHP